MIDIASGTFSSAIPREEIELLLPHRGKMLLLSRVTSYDVSLRRIETEYDIHDTCVFYDKVIDGIPAWTSFEIMAQSVSAMASLLHIVRHDFVKARIGFLLSISGCAINVPVFKKDTTVRVTAQEYFEADGVYMYDCCLYVDKDTDVPAVTARLTAMEADDVKSVLSQAERRK